MHTFLFKHYQNDSPIRDRLKIEVYNDDVFTFSMSVEYGADLAESTSDIYAYRGNLETLRVLVKCLSMEVPIRADPVRLYMPDYGAHLYIEVIPHQEVAFYEGYRESKNDSFCYVIHWDNCDHVSLLTALQDCLSALEVKKIELDEHESSDSSDE